MTVLCISGCVKIEENNKNSQALFRIFIYGFAGQNNKYPWMDSSEKKLRNEKISGQLSQFFSFCQAVNFFK